jgi:hypothetical protein
MSARAKPPVRGPLSRRRKAAVTTLVVLASLTAFVSTLTIWVKRQALETDAWTKTSASLLEDHQIREAVSVYLVDQLYANVDVAEELRKGLPESTRGLAPPLAGGLRELSTRTAENLLGGARVQSLWETANRRAHEQLLKVVEGKSKEIHTRHEAVVLDLRPFVLRLADQIGLRESVDANLPAEVGQIQIMRSNQLRRIQIAVRVIRVLSVFLIALAVVLYGLAVYIARGHRRQVVRTAGISVAVVGVTLLVVRRIVGDQVVNTLASSESERTPAWHAWLIGTSLLADIAWTMVAYGLVTVAAAWIAGASPSATRLRRALAPDFRERPGLIYAIVGAAYLALVLWGPTRAQREIVFVLLFAVVLTIGTEVLRRRTLAEFPDIDRASDSGLVDRLHHAADAILSPYHDDDRLDRLERLARLRESGALTKEEFLREKRALLGDGPRSATGSGRGASAGKKDGPRRRPTG